jgi:hypothetical protein
MCKNNYFTVLCRWLKIFSFFHLIRKDNLLRNKIPLPVNEARNMFGVADVTGKLKYGQCFIQYQKRTKQGTTYTVLKGKYLFLIF